MATLSTLEDIYIDMLCDTYNAEIQITKVLPRIAKAVSNDDLLQAFEHHLAETEEHVTRLETVFAMAGQKARGKQCEAMEGLLDEGKELLSAEIEDAAFDAAIIAAVQKIEHYEIAAYGTLVTWAKQLGLGDQAALLEQTLSEEKGADERLTDIAESIVNAEAEESGTVPYSISSNGHAGRTKQ
jgi:ferritin-like metal-binding protein YciE